MRAVVVYESMYGSTHVIADAIGTGLKTAFDVSVVPVSQASPGLRAWFGSLGRYPVKATAFDTRIHAPAALTGQASKGVARLPRAHGFGLVAEPESFLVTKQDRVEPQESARAREWAATLAAGLAPRPVPGTRS